MDSDWLFLLVLGWLFQADSNIVIEVGFAKEQFYSRIYSGFKGDKSGMEVVEAGSSNIEKAIGGSN